ncbi:pirin family protein [Photobacterium galatheae]|nr:pirin family protein [Photobacterium galatheae]
MKATRTINKIRYGRKSGPMTAYIYHDNLTELNSELNPFVLWDHFDANGIKEETGLDYHGHSGIEAFSYPVTGTLHHTDSCGRSQRSRGHASGESETLAAPFPATGSGRQH